MSRFYVWLCVWFYVWSCCMLMAGLWGCTDIITLPYPEGEAEKIAISASVVHSKPVHILVQVSEVATDLNTQRVPPPIEDAVVQVLDAEGRALLVPGLGNGRYELWYDEAGEVQFEVGEAYRLEVVLPDGRTYASAAAHLPAPLAPDSVRVRAFTRTLLNEVENPVERTFLRFMIDTPVRYADGSPAYLLWRFESVYKFSELDPPGIAGPNFCFVELPINLDKVSAFSGAVSVAAYGDSLAMFEMASGSIFSEGMYLTTYQHTITADAHTYWDQVRRVSDRRGGQFDPPPGPIASNIVCVSDPGSEVLGYFYAASVDTIRRKVLWQEAGQPKLYCSSYAAFDYFEAPLICRNCLEIDNSNYERPDYWK
ncbi:MAG: hypothetical protein OHK0039_23100 [Bacteroidia bacterium]